MTQAEPTPETIIEAAEKKYSTQAYVANRFFADEDRLDDWAVYLWEDEMRPYHPSRWMFKDSAKSLSALLAKLEEAR